LPQELQISLRMCHNKETSFIEENKAVKARGLSPKSEQDLDRMIDLILEDLTAFMKHQNYKGIPPQWRPASFAIIPGVFDETNGLVNSTMKLVRHKVKDLYMSRLDELYSLSTADPRVAGNREALKSVLEMTNEE